MKKLDLEKIVAILLGAFLGVVLFHTFSCNTPAPVVVKDTVADSITHVEYLKHIDDSIANSIKADSAVKTMTDR